MTIARRHTGAGFTTVENVSGIQGWSLAEIDFPELPGAVCKDDPDPDAWFPERGRPSARQLAAVAKCNRCPVKQQCLDYALAYDAKREGSDTLTGIWGGLTDSQRKKLPKAKSARRCRSGKHELNPGTRGCYACKLEANREWKRRQKEAS